MNELIEGWIDSWVVRVLTDGWKNGVMDRATDDVYIGGSTDEELG